MRETCQTGAAGLCCRYFVPALQVLALLAVFVAAMWVPAA